MDKKIVKEIIPECARKFSFGKYRYYIFNKPDLVFSDNHKMELFEFTAKLIQETFEKEDQSYFRSRKNYFGDIDQYWLVLDKGGEAVGFCGVKKLCYEGRDAIYLDTVNIAREHQGNGIASIMVCLTWLLNSISSRSFVPFAMRTQNPAVYKSIIRMVEPNVIPEIDYVCERKVRQRIYGFARYVAEMMSKGAEVDYDEETSVCRSAYGRNLYRKGFRFSSEDSVTRYFDAVLNRDAGDTMMVVVWPRVTPYRFLRMLALMVPRSVPVPMLKSSRSSQA
ncbi:GNAT family N-acetyltransferase [Alcanivorax sediminis]|uniref:GNAT family N-acetyltransferase n=1 Tax=Alcanivorax sediminis TaxID=2663008 RepID=A0A6N7LPP2_9GAMM|nr:GNAT family N-acetyltransferase [Alcanivorax sediminis]MQX51993.1 GNAT family N-acetyltransferase [Alcanivorax sediminis]